jgi:hypothetical protein
MLLPDPSSGPISVEPASMQPPTPQSRVQAFEVRVWCQCKVSHLCQQLVPLIPGSLVGTYSSIPSAVGTLESQSIHAAVSDDARD